MIRTERGRTICKNLNFNEIKRIRTCDSDIRRFQNGRF